MDSIAIVGGGIIGSGLAYHLRDAPAEVTLLEKGALGSGTTSASIAVFSWLSAHPDPFTHRLREEAWSVYSDLIDAGEIDFERVGALSVAESAAHLEELEAAAGEFRDLGLDVEVRDPGGLAELGIEPDGLLGGIYLPDEGYLDPTEIVRYWTREAAAAGVDIETGVEVTGVRVDDGAVAGVETGEGAMDAGTVICAAGPWSPAVAGMAGVDLPVRHTYGRILVLQVAEALSLPYTLFEDGHYFREEGTSQAFAGRLEKSYPEARRYDPDAVHSIEEPFRRAVAGRAARYVPALEGAEVVNEWVGLRAVTPDTDPLLGPTGVEGLLVATGMSGLGITLAPAVTGALAEYALSGSNGVVERLSVDRFD